MNQKIQELAREALSWFEHRTWYWTIKNGAPEWVQELVWVAHAEGEILPVIVEALGALAEGEHNQAGQMMEKEEVLGLVRQFLEMARGGHASAWRRAAQHTLGGVFDDDGSDVDG